MGLGTGWAFKEIKISKGQPRPISTKGGKSLRASESID